MAALGLNKLNASVKFAMRNTAAATGPSRSTRAPDGRPFVRASPE